ncbi:MAG TPA: glycosyl hydrolase [Planctomycetota bacterium]|nr:glycosyl hydrolase [Planctomycetota bacterium]
MNIDYALQPRDLKPALARLWKLSAQKLLAIDKTYPAAKGTPVFTIKGKYTSRGWTEWTQGFLYGSSVLQFDATGDKKFLALGRDNTVAHMASHVTHFGVHDHGFNNVSTYGNLLRLMLEGRIPFDARERDFYVLALQASGAVQAARWSTTADGRGYIYSFNGPHSLFSDTIRSLRALAAAHLLGHAFMGEQDRKTSLIERLVQHALVTAQYNIYYGKGRDAYDLPATRGRVVHESIFNPNNGVYRCPSTQQGYSPFSTWTRGLAWILTGYAEQLEFLPLVADAELQPFGGRTKVTAAFRQAAEATADFYLAFSATDGIPYWDTGAENLHKLGADLYDRPADPFNAHEPVDSSAAAIACQGFLRLGRVLDAAGNKTKAKTCRQAGLTLLRTLLNEPYLSTAADHQGLILHSVYHRPNGWDYIPPKQKVPCGESSLWGDYHAREAALYVQRLIDGGPYYTFFAGLTTARNATGSRAPSSRRSRK